MKPSNKLSIVILERGKGLGYRKSESGSGSWTARRYVSGTKYEFHFIGLADDGSPADGVTVFDYSQAKAAAEKWFKQRALEDDGEIDVGMYTVADAGKDWLAAWDGSEAGKINAEANLKHHILPTLGSIQVSKLRKAKVQDWLQNLAKKPPVKVQQRQALAKKLPPSRQRKIVFNPNDPETKRKRRDTANRVFNDLSALLTHAYKNEKVLSKAAWEKVAKFENVGIAHKEYLELEEAKRFIEICPEDFRDLVQAALITGCRYMELCRMKASDYDASIKAISLIQGKTRKVKHVFLTDDEAAFFDAHTKGKAEDDLIFMQLKVDEKTGEVSAEPWKKSNQQPRMRAALKASGVKRHVRFKDLRATFATLLVKRGVSIQLVANQLGHSGTRIAEAHYARYSPSYIAATIRENKPNYGIAKAE